MFSGVVKRVLLFVSPLDVSGIGERQEDPSCQNTYTYTQVHATAYETISDNCMLQTSWQQFGEGLFLSHDCATVHNPRSMKAWFGDFGV